MTSINLGSFQSSLIRARKPDQDVCRGRVALDNTRRPAPVRGADHPDAQQGRILARPGYPPHRRAVTDVPHRNLRPASDLSRGANSTGQRTRRDSPVSSDNRFLEGSFAPVTEEITAFDLPVTGQLPAGLSGRYLRNGPNPLDLDDPHYHWFLGAGMVHGVRLRDGKAEWYRNRWVRSKAVAAAHGRAVAGRPGAREHGLCRQHPHHRARRPHPGNRGGRARCRMRCPMSWTPSARATSPGPCQAASPRTLSSTTPPANCTPSPTSGPGITSSTSSSTQAARSPAPPTSPLPTAR